MDALIFIDTNIFLDFYRIRKTEVSMSYLKLIEDHQNIIITGSQIEMEYKKNRQAVIIESQGQFKNPDWNNLTVPALLSETDEAKRIDELRKQVTEQQTKISKKIEGILKSPDSTDPVFKALGKLFNSKSNYNLNRDHKDRISIRERAVKRFMLGYPPRKKNDTSIGDAINWEWLVHCASSAKKHVIVVTRDGDYGVTLKAESFINDWLFQEFKERVAPNFNIILTTRLSEAFKAIDVTISEDMVKEETRIIEESTGFELNDRNDNVTNKIFDILKKYD